MKKYSYSEIKNALNLFTAPNVIWPRAAGRSNCIGGSNFHRIMAIAPEEEKYNILSQVSCILIYCDIHHEMIKNENNNLTIYVMADLEQ